MLRVLIADTQFLISVSVLPARVSFSNPPRQTFGQVMALLRSGVEFSKKKRLLELAGSLNDIRNGVAHKLLQRGSFSGLRRDAQKSLRLYERTFSIFDEAHDDFRVTFSAIAKDFM